MSSSSEGEAIPSPLTSFQAYHPLLLRSLTAASRSASLLPEDVDFHRSLDRKFAKAVDSCSERLLALASQLVKYSSEGSAAAGEQDKGKGKAKALELRDREDVEDRYPLVVDVTDGLLERADTALDALMGRVVAPKVEVKEPRKRRDPTSMALTLPSGRLSPHILHAKIPKPQLLFSHPADNFPLPGWAPNLRLPKVHALKPVGWRPETEEEWALVRGEGREKREEWKGRERGVYAYEILTAHPPSWALERPEPQEAKPFDQTPFTWVSTPSQLSALLEALKKAKEIAIDLEHHDYRSYWGIVCLMQISTREGDWVVDTLALREELEVLNEVFADPGVVKVLHGAHMDTIWLQRDLNLYLVNLFDTYHASRLLSFPAHSLAFLLEYYCSFKPDKRFQLADWRIRPLPQEMLEYARSDTHFLLWVWDLLRRDLREKAGGGEELVRKVFVLSQETASQVWEPERYEPLTPPAGSGGGGMDAPARLARKWNKHFFGAKEAVYRALFDWRDRVAREEDESVRYVMPNHQLFALAEGSPREERGVRAVLQGGAGLALERVGELARLVAGVLDGEKERERERKEQERREEMSRLQVRVDAAAAGVGKGEKGNRFALLQPAEEEMQQDAAVQEPIPPALPSVDIWGTAGNALAAPSSSFFGKLLPSTAPQPATALSAPSSALFGNALPSASTRDDPKFQAAIQQIHSSLFLAPTVQAAFPPAKVAPAFVSAAATAEVPFVPKSQRQTKEEVDERNTIVVVGQKAGKKRKRAMQVDEVVAAAEGSASPVPDAVEQNGVRDDQMPQNEEGEGFDYASQPNLLDDDPSTLAGKKLKKQKKNKGPKPSMQSNDFKKPPKPGTDPKTGNRSMTFK